ncbi:MAG: bacillithiol biosynthesis BshC [Planctomycetota bacterium]|nr:bacillithiol biosynthesis BshC [Planctomycetota bacterium]
MSAFARALRTGEGAPLEYLDPPPRDDEGWCALLDRTAAAVTPVPAALADALAGRQEALGAGAQAVANAQALGATDRPTLAVVTGQQAGLLGGPLLTFHKAAGAIALARKLDGLGGHRVVPLFWLASEDHDFDEANRAVVIDRAGQAQGLRLAMQGDGRSLMDVDVPAECSEALEAELAAALPDTERSRDVQALVARRPGEDPATWAARALVAVFGDSGLVVVEPPVLLPWVGETYGWLLDHAETIRAAVDATGEALVAAGLPAPLHPQAPDATPLFFRREAGGPRLRIGLDGESPTLRGEPAGMTRAELRATLVAHPEQGSGNVIGRVFVQNRHLPTLCYVAGPSEIAYQAQVRTAAEATGTFFPLALPRPEATWVDAKTEAALIDLDRSARAVLAGAEAPAESQDEALVAGLAAVTKRLEDLATDAEGLLARGGRGADAVRRALERTAQTWTKAEVSIQRAFDLDAGVGRARWARGLALLKPHGKGQDRLLSPVSLAARHGLAAVRAGLDSMDCLRPAHHLVHLGGGPRTEDTNA